jgi:Ca2+-transporting ATPase
MLAVSLAVVAVPEGLPAVVTVALALGLQRMVRRHALVRKLPSVETLGCVTVICTDKTGTLTRNEMTLERLIAGRRAYAVTGSGYAPRGRFLEDGGRPVDPGEAPDLALALTAGARCNHARLTMRADRDDVWEVVGDPTEGALLVAAEKAGIGTADGAAPRVVFEIPFDSDRKAMSVVVEEPGGARAMYVKGAPEVIVAKCDRERAGGADVALDAARREAILAAGAALAARGLRVLALAWKPIGAAAPPYEESGLAFLGLAGMRDPPREEAREAVARCHGAGIRPIMITGDHPQTALAIARELGIAAEGDRVTTGQELDRTADDRLLAELERVPVYARVAAEHKLRIVRAWKQRGEIVAMTGDGVNDATAVKAADIGIAMGITGTDVTKEAADMVLTDDNFASIVNAVEEGRGIFDNIQKFVFYLLCCNFGAIVLMLVASLAGWPAPLFPMQLLWINLVTNGLPALAMALEPPEPGIMQRRPRRPNEPMFSAHRATRIALEGALIGLVAIAGFFAVYGRGPAFLGAARTTAFCLLVFADLLFAIAARSASLPLVRLGLTTNPWLLAAILGSAALQLAVVAIPWLGRVFETVSWREVPWWIVGPGAVLPFAAVEAMKMLRGEEAARR